MKGLDTTGFLLSILMIIVAPFLVSLVVIERSFLVTLFVMILGWMFFNSINNIIYSMRTKKRIKGGRK